MLVTTDLVLCECTHKVQVSLRARQPLSDSCSYACSASSGPQSVGHGPRPSSLHSVGHWPLVLGVDSWQLAASHSRTRSAKALSDTSTAQLAPSRTAASPVACRDLSRRIHCSHDAPQRHAAGAPLPLEADMPSCLRAAPDSRYEQTHAFAAVMVWLSCIGTASCALPLTDSCSPFHPRAPLVSRQLVRACQGHYWAVKRVWQDFRFVLSLLSSPWADSSDSRNSSNPTAMKAEPQASRWIPVWRLECGMARAWAWPHSPPAPCLPWVTCTGRCMVAYGWHVIINQI